MTELQKIGRYQIKHVLGSGSYANVYKATDTLLKRTVALKILKPALLADQEAFSRFITEAQIGASLIHPRIAWVWDLGEVDGRYFIAMRYVDGSSLDKVIAEKGCLSWEQALSITRQVGEALSFAHAAGLVHRDVKPQNIILSPGEGAVLTDFGLVRAMEASGSLTRTGMMLGTPQYMPPEVWSGETAGPAADQYALACVLVQMLTGKCPFDAPTPPAIMMKHFAPVVLPEQWSGGATAGITKALTKAFDKQPASRYTDIEALIKALSDAQQAPLPAPTISAPDKDKFEIKWRDSQYCEIWYSDDERLKACIAEILQKPEPVTSLKVMYGNITDSGIASLNQLANLKDLTVFGNPQITSEGWQFLRNLRSLNSLSLSSGKNFTNRAFSVFAEMNDLQNLNIQNRGPSGKEGANYLRSLKNLKRLTLFDNYKNTKPSDLEWLVDMTSLDYLNLGEADLTDDALSYIARLKTLRRLDLHGNEAITGRGLRYLTSLLTLEELSLPYSHGIKDEDLDVVGTFPKIRSLSLIHSNGITDRGLMKLTEFENVKNLRFLFIYGCKQTSQAARQQVKMILKNVDVRTGDE